MPLRLLWRNLLGHPIRAVLTALSVAVAVFLLCILDAADRGISASLANASRTRLWVQSAVSLFVMLPEGYQQKIAQVPGVASICRFQWFGGTYIEPANFFPQYAVDADTWFRSYPELQVVAGDYEAFRKDRGKCMVGADLMAKYGWQLGDHVPLIGTIFPRIDGTPWDFTIGGVYRSTSANIDQSSMFFHYDYLQQALEQRQCLGPVGVGVFLTALEPSRPPEAVIADLEALFQNGPQRIRATPEAEFQRQFVTMLGDVPALLHSIGGGVLFAIFFAVLNTMLMAGRERTRDLGILKALGFANGTLAALLLGESVLLCLCGGGLGAGLSIALERPIWTFTSTLIPGFAIDRAVVLQGLLLALLLGLLAGLGPAMRARRLFPVVALRSEA